jgi:anti-sigma B factor antagonist
MVRQQDDEPAMTVVFDRPVPTVLVAKVVGNLDLATAPELDNQVRSELDRMRARRLVVDLSGLQFLSPRGTAVLERLRRAGAARGTILSLAALPPVGERALRFVGALTHFDRHADLTSAVAAARTADGGTGQDQSGRSISGQRRCAPDER